VGENFIRLAIILTGLGLVNNDGLFILAGG